MNFYKLEQVINNFSNFLLTFIKIEYNEKQEINNKKKNIINKLETFDFKMQISILKVF